MKIHFTGYSTKNTMVSLKVKRAGLFGKSFDDGTRVGPYKPYIDMITGYFGEGGELCFIDGRPVYSRYQSSVLPEVPRYAISVRDCAGQWFTKSDWDNLHGTH